MTNENELATQGQTVLTEMPAYLKNKNSNRGSEEVTAADITIPRLDIVQALSPCLDEKKEADYIPGAKTGMLFNSITRQLYGKSVKFVPVVVIKQWNIWKDRKQGGGFNGSYETLALAEEAKKAIVANGENPAFYDILETAVNYGLLINENGSIQEISIPMAKSKLKINRQLNSLVRMAGGDRWDRVYDCKVVPDSSKLGDFFNFNFQWAGFPSEAVSAKAEEIYNLVKEGRAKTSYDHEVAHDEDTVATVEKEEY
jgi:hypothetical protein